VAPPSADVRVSSSGYSGPLRLLVPGYASGSPAAAPVDAAVAVFRTANPTIDLTVMGYTPDQAGLGRLERALREGGRADAVRLPADLLPPLVQVGVLAPIDAFLSDADRSDIVPQLLQAVRVNGQTWAWPWWVTPTAMYLNLDLFQERGITPPGPDWTYEQFVELAKQLTFQDGDRQVAGFSSSLDGSSLSVWPLFMNEGPQVRPLLNENRSFGFASPEAVAGLQRFAELTLVHKVTPPNFGLATLPEVQDGFRQKAWAMVADSSGPAVAYANENLNFAVLPMPTYRGQRITTGGLGVLAVAMNNDPARLQAAMDLARYLSSAAAAQDAPGLFLAPGARASVALAAPLNLFISMVPDTYAPPLLAAWPQIRAIMQAELQQIVLGRSSAAEAMQRVAPEIDRLLAQV
jgi:multiple sugar transport system substrate-binding protein